MERRNIQTPKLETSSGSIDVNDMSPSEKFQDPSAIKGITFRVITPSIESNAAGPLQFIKEENVEDKQDPVNLNPNWEARLERDIDSLLIYTKAVKWPTLKETIFELRFMLRLIQFTFALGILTRLILVAAFLNIGYTALANRYTSSTLEASGIPFFCFVCIVSKFVSIANMFLYSFPGFLGIPPHRHKRISRVEFSFDILMTALWLITSSHLVSYGECPDQITSSFLVSNHIFFINKSTLYCPTLQGAFILGYLGAITYFWRFVQGVRDQRVKLAGLTGKHIMFARGSWKS